MHAQYRFTDASSTILRSKQKANSLAKGWRLEIEQQSTGLRVRIRLLIRRRLSIEGVMR